MDTERAVSDSLIRPQAQLPRFGLRREHRLTAFAALLLHDEKGLAVLEATHTIQRETQGRLQCWRLITCRTRAGHQKGHEFGESRVVVVRDKIQVSVQLAQVDALDATGVGGHEMLRAKPANDSELVLQKGGVRVRLIAVVIEGEARVGRRARGKRSRYL